MARKPRAPGPVLSNETRIAPLDDDDDDAQYLGNRVDSTRAAPPDRDNLTGSMTFHRTGSMRIDPVEDDALWSRADETRTGPVRTVAPAPLDAPLHAGSVDDSRTMFSSRAALIADLVKSRFSKRIYGRSPHRIVRIEGLEGPSTAGGLLARQPISLVARKGSAPSIVCGWVDVSKKEALLRSYESLSRRHEARHGMPMDLPVGEYERFMDELLEALFTCGMQVRIVVPDDPLPARSPEAVQAARPASRSGVGVFLLVVLAFALGVVAGKMMPWPLDWPMP